MKINIQIEDASLKELQWLFGGVSATPDDHALLPMPVLDKLLKAYPEKAERKPDLPTHEEIKREQDAGKKPAPKEKGRVWKGSTKRNTFGFPNSAKEKYQIPFNSMVQKKEYQNAVNLCKKYDKPYPESLKLKEVDLKLKEAKKAGKSVKKQSGVQAGSDSGVHKPPSDIKIGGIDKDLMAAMPDARPQTRGDAANDFKIGVHVKQIKPYLDRKVSGIGAVTALVKGLVEVNFSGTQYYKIAPDCLEVV
jgi:hypothetical protein